MAEEAAGVNVRTWKLGTALAGLVALLMAGWAYSESQRATALQITLDSTIAEANARISEANAALQQAAKRDLPISVSFRPALLGSGLVATFKNNSSQTIEVAAVFSSPALVNRNRPTLLSRRPVCRRSDTQKDGRSPPAIMSRSRTTSFARSNTSFQVLERSPAPTTFVGLWVAVANVELAQEERLRWSGV